MSKAHAIKNEVKKMQKINFDKVADKISQCKQQADRRIDDLKTTLYNTREELAKLESGIDEAKGVILACFIMQADFASMAEGGQLEKAKSIEWIENRINKIIEEKAALWHSETLFIKAITEKEGEEQEEAKYKAEEVLSKIGKTTGALRFYCHMQNFILKETQKETEKETKSEE